MINIDDIQKVKATSLREAITIYFQDAITGGLLKPGDCLPSSRELAQHLNTSFPNVHQALVPLVKSGLLLRDRKKGTIVREQKTELRCVAIYVYRTNIDDMPQFQHVLIDQISNQLAAKNISTRLILDNDLFFGMEQLKKWTQQNEIQGIIVPIGGAAMREAVKKFNNLPVPIVEADNVVLDMTRLVTLAVKALKKEKCRKVAVISTIEHFSRNEHGELEESKFYKDLFKAMAGANLEFDPDRIITVHDDSKYFHSTANMTNFAFEQCNALLTLPPEKRPDGIFVFPDQLVTGIMLSVMKNAMKIPDELTLVIHRNWEIDVPIFTPCSMVGISIAENAECIIENLIDGFNGIPPKKYKIKPELKM